MRKVILTSFRDAKNHHCTKFSIARWQPKGYSYPELKRLAPYYQDGRPIKGISPYEFRIAYETNVLTQDSATAQLVSVIASMGYNETIALLCWCNPSRQPPPKKLMCHRILVGYWIENHCSDVEVVYLDGAENSVWSRT